MGREDELFDKYMLIRQMTEAVRNKNTSKAGPLGDTTRGRGRVLALLKQKDGEHQGYGNYHGHSRLLPQRGSRQDGEGGLCRAYGFSGR